MNIRLHYDVPGDDFTRAGEASSAVKRKLKQLGFQPDVIRRVAIAMYEGEINTIIHGKGGGADIYISPEQIRIVFTDHGPGIADIEKAMQEGFSTASDEARELGFGAGMGLPNMKKYTDEMKIDSKVNEGTTVFMRVDVA